MKKTEENKNTIILFNRNNKGYITAELGSEAHATAVNQGYEYRGPAYVAKWTESIAMREANEAFMKTLI
jgi:hypothetical protein